MIPDGFEPDAALSGFVSIGASLTTVSATAAEKFESAANDIAAQAFSDPSRRQRIVRCTPVAAVDEGCARSFVATFGRRAWRRPLKDDEIDRYTGLATQGAALLGDFWQGLGFALSGLLQSPYFLYRVELGQPGPKPGLRAFDAWELASRLSFFLSNSTPDDALLDAAEKSALTGPHGLREQAERLLASPRGQVVVRSFFYELMRLDDLEDLKQSPAEFPRATRTVGPAMQEETLQLLAAIAASADGDLRQALDAPFTFVNQELGQLYARSTGCRGRERPRPSSSTTSRPT